MGDGQRRQRTGACLEFNWTRPSVQPTMGISSWQGLLSWLSPSSRHKSSSLSQEKHHHGQVVVFIMKVSVIYLSSQDSPNTRLNWTCLNTVSHHSIEDLLLCVYNITKINNTIKMPKLWSLVEARGKVVKNNCMFFRVALHYISALRRRSH